MVQMIKEAHEEKSICIINFQVTLFVLTFTVFVTERSLSHVTEPYRALAAAVGEGVTLLGMKLRRCDHLCQIFHVGWLNVHDV